MLNTQEIYLYNHMFCIKNDKNFKTGQIDVLIFSKP